LSQPYLSLSFGLLKKEIGRKNKNFWRMGANGASIPLEVERFDAMRMAKDPLHMTFLSSAVTLERKNG